MIKRKMYLNIEGCVENSPICTIFKPKDVWRQFHFVPVVLG